MADGTTAQELVSQSKCGKATGRQAEFAGRPILMTAVEAQTSVRSWPR